MSRRIPVVLLVFAVLLVLGGCAKKSPQTPSSYDPSASRDVAPGTGFASYEDDAAGRDVGTSELDRSALLGAVYFDFDRYELRSDAREQLAKNADYLLANPHVLVTIEGHCDERGTNAYNLALGAQRAGTAKRYLVSLGVDGHRLDTISYGEERPACTESNEGCWRLNRRAHFFVTGHSNLG